MVVEQFIETGINIVLKKERKSLNPKVWLEKSRYYEGRYFTYRIRWRDPWSSRIKSKTIGFSREEAAREAHNLRRELRGILWAPEKYAWDRFVAEDLEYLAAQHTPGMVKIQRRVYRYFTAICKPVTLADVTRQQIERYVTVRQKQGVRPATINLDLRCLRAGLYRAQQRGFIGVNPLAPQGGNIFVKEPERAPKALTEKEFQALLSACPTKYWRGICLMGYHAGLRLGEILALQWGDVDLDDRVLWIKNKHFHRTKSGKNRAIPLVEPLGEFLAGLRPRNFRNEDLVFASTSLRPRHRLLVASTSNAFASIVKKAKLVDEQDRHRFTMHDLRRTAVTRWLRSGMTPQDVQKLAGHEDLRTTLRHYAEVMTVEHLRQAIERIDTPNT